MPIKTKKVNGYKGQWGSKETKRTYATKEGARKGAGKIAQASYGSGYRKR